jgi:hypothetical protein
VDKPLLARTGPFRKVLEKQVGGSCWFFIEKLTKKLRF